MGGFCDYTCMPSGSKQNVGHFSELNNNELLKKDPLNPVP
jgi:hypothetical protein